jgi:hypothetical protein
VKLPDAAEVIDGIDGAYYRPTRVRLLRADRAAVLRYAAENFLDWLDTSDVHDPLKVKRGLQRQADRIESGEEDNDGNETT